MPDAPDDVVNRKLAELFREPFDLATGPLLRPHLIATAADDHVLMVMIHHIVSNAWSNKVVMQELGALYTAECAGTVAALPPLPAQYADYAIWQRDWLQGEELERQVGYWKERLTGAPLALDMPTDRPRPPVQTFNGDVAGWQIDARTAAGLNRLAQDTRLHPLYGADRRLQPVARPPQQPGRPADRHTHSGPPADRTRKTHRFLREYAGAAVRLQRQPALQRFP